MAQNGEERDFICQGWQYDPVMRELRVYSREKKDRWSAEPLDTIQLGSMARIVWHRWSQQPSQPHYGGDVPVASQSRIVVTFSDGRELSLSENDRDCAGQLAALLGRESGLKVEETGAPGRNLRTTPLRDSQGRYAGPVGKAALATDMVTREVTVTSRRFPLRRRQLRIPFAEVRRLELEYSVKLPFEEYAVVATYGPDEQRQPIIVYRGWEGWAGPEEWRRFAQELASEMSVELKA